MDQITTCDKILDCHLSPSQEERHATPSTTVISMTSRSCSLALPKDILTCRIINQANVTVDGLISVIRVLDIGNFG